MPNDPNGPDSALDQPSSEGAATQPVGANGYRSTLAAEDWDALFDAVATRLRRTAGEPLPPHPEVPAHLAALTAGPIRAVMLDCVGALEQLHVALKHERSRRPTP